MAEADTRPLEQRLALAKKAEAAMDDFNAVFGHVAALCFFCLANEYDSIQGILHRVNPECVILQLRRVIAVWEKS